ncbi:MAG: UDP-N-acetylmuramoyl-L-alanine--D-glutamate ligase [Synergistaceae bacterium]|jgi:UDP-N-acetylmuramoylalanine--D-glutamate ligase|nr:UDP-N-acetylmuramoyl-L-alanine--D-glutamate ligase [Synergistaceae bacterium]
MDIKDWSSKRITVIGGGVSGTALALLARELGAEVFLSEERDTLAGDTLDRLKNADVEWELGGHSSRAFEADTLLLSSGIPPHAFCVQEAARRGVPVMGELDFVVPRIEGRIVGITGSNGKSTSTSLSGHIFQKMGYKTGVGGNIGEAASLFTGEGFDYVVLELSSFQLHWAHNLKSAVGVVTNLAPDHIDWHGSYENYIAAKAKLLSLQGPEGWSIVQDRDCKALHVEKLDKTVVLSWSEQPENKTAGHIFMGKDRASLRLGGKERGKEGGGERPLFRYEDTTLLGRHNLENAAMALAAAHLLGVEVRDEREIFAGFKPLPHRCELVAALDGVAYVDDSKGTNVAASVTALTSVEGRKIAILGGKGKGEDYGALAEAVMKKAEAAVLIGAEKDRIEIALKKAGFANSYRAADMEEAVSLARKLARPGMVVLLSPACTSWDMYENYKQRGEHFRAVVRSLES